MGLLDSLFDSSTYGGDGGLLSRLLPMTGAIPQSAGFPQTQQPVNPIAVGGYQMPRMGDAAQYQPDSAALPANAQPTQGQIPAAAPQTQQLPPALGGNQIGGNFGAGLQNFVSSPGGLLGKVAGGITGLATGQRTDPAGMQQQNLRAQYDSLVPILGPQKALLAVMNPEAGKTLLTEALTNKEQFTKTGTDAMGRDIYGFVNPFEQTVNGKPVNSAAPASSDGGIGDMNKTGESYLSTLPKPVANTVKGMVDGTIAPPSSFALSKPYWQTMIAAAQNYDPTFDATKWGAREAMRKDLAKSTPGSAGGQQTFMNTSLSHLKEVAQKAKDLGNWDLGIGPITELANKARGLSTTQQAKVQALQDAAQHYGQEVTKFYAGSPGGEAERSRFLSALSGAKSPQELAAVLESELSLIPGRGNELETRVRNTLGDNYLAQNPLLSEDSKKAITETQKIIAELRGVSAPSAPQASSGLPQGWSVKVH